MKGKRKAKALSDCERHFRHRLLQRYGIALGARYLHFNNVVRNGGATFLFRESNSRTHWSLEIDGKQVRLVYEKLRGGIVTALPPLIDVEAA